MQNQNFQNKIMIKHLHSTIQDYVKKIFFNQHNELFL